MSLAMVLANPYGIVMTADRRLTTTVSVKNIATTESFFLTDHAQKIFLTKAGHGITYTGASDFNDGTCTSEIIKDAINEYNNPKAPVQSELLFIKRKLAEHKDTRGLTLLGAEIRDTKRHVYAISLNKDSIDKQTNENGNCFIFSGESDLAKKIAEMLPVNQNRFPVQESINYLRFINSTVAGMLHYAQRNQTVSEECDVLVITADGSRWITEPCNLY